jgi:hypothetical protein
MNTALISLILVAPFAVAAALSWAAHRNGHLRMNLDQFHWAIPMTGLLAGDNTDDRDSLRTRHDIDAIRTRFERQPSWPDSGASGERR